MKFVLITSKGGYQFIIHIDRIKFVNIGKDECCVLTVHRNKAELREGVTEEIELKESFSEFIEKLKNHRVIIV